MTIPDEPMILTDSREQRPLRFSCQTMTATLRTGDYSVEGYGDTVGIERKSLDDLIQCLSQQRARFERELLRARDMDYFSVIVEAPFSDLANGNYRSKFHPNSAVESISTFEVRYNIPFLFCGNRELAARKCESLLRKYHRERMNNLKESIPF